MLYGDLLDGAVSYSLGGFNGTGEDTNDNNSEVGIVSAMEGTWRGSWGRRR
jgi:hypothetical protein